jgi:hypothetical protein
MLYAILKLFITGIQQCSPNLTATSKELDKNAARIYMHLKFITKRHPNIGTERKIPIKEDFEL